MQRHVRSSSKPHRRRTEDKLNLDELASAPNLGGMLSFLEVPPEEAQRRYALRQEMEQGEATDPEGPSSVRVRAMNTESPTVGIKPSAGISPPVGHENIEKGFPSLPPETRKRQGESFVDSVKHVAGVVYTTEVEKPPVGHTVAVDFENIPGSGEPQIRRTQEPQFDAPSNCTNATLVETPPIAQIPTVGVTTKLEPVHTAAQPPLAIRDPEDALQIPPTEGYSSREVEQPPVGGITIGQQTPEFGTDPPAVDFATGYLPSLGPSAPTHKRERIFRATLVQHGHSRG